MERFSEDPIRSDVPADPLIAGPCDRAREEARVGLYVHVPFCAVRCTYCHFSTGPLSAAALERWFSGLEREVGLRGALASGTAFTSVFFGGGTPSSLSSRHFRRLWALLRGSFTIAPGAEITLEANPESVKAPLLEAWLEAGVNRLSLGAQSFEPAELRALGRIHDEHRPAEAIALARAHGFRRLSLDLMFAYPGHASESFARSLDEAFALEPEHVSAYAFIPEAGTAMGDAVLSGAAAVPDDAAQANLYEQWLARSAAAGFAPYETSNVALPGAEARHNLTYWLRRDYLALGPSAHSLWQGTRWGNHYSLADWADALERGEAPEAERERENAESATDEIVMLGLRLASGLRLADYDSMDREQVEARYGAAFRAASVQGRLVQTEQGWRLPAAHRFLADDTIAWLAARARTFDSVSRSSLNSVPCPPRLSPVA